MRAACAAALLAALPCALHAQNAGLRAQCDAGSRPAVREFCRNVADAAIILQPRMGIAQSGGNPVPGTASTLGMRIGSIPRTSLALRASAAYAGLPPIRRIDSVEDVTFPVGSINADMSIGILPGLSLLPTVGGLGSVDLIGSVGILPLPRGEGFDDSAPITWAAGARIGILRESFTAPGVSIDLLHRRMGPAAWGSADLTEEDVWLRMTGMRASSARAVVGKRLFGFGLTGGIAYDRYTMDVEASIRDAVVLDPARVLDIAGDRISTGRTAIFANASLTLLVLNLGTEVGWQQGAEAIDGASGRRQRGSIFGGLAIRLAI
jgi:hypothetical protein